MRRLKKNILMPLCAMTLAVSSIATHAPIAYASAVSVPSPRWSYLNMIRGSMKVDDKNITKISVACSSHAFNTDKIAANANYSRWKAPGRRIRPGRKKTTVPISCIIRSGLLQRTTAIG